MIQLVIFDLDNTLCDYDASLSRVRARVGIILREASIPQEPFWEAFSEIEPVMQCAMVDGFLSAAECTWRIFSEVCAKFVGCVGVLPDVMARIFYEETVSRQRLFDDVSGAIVDLKKSGIRVAVLTEGDSASQREKFRVLGLQQLVGSGSFYVSEELGVQKKSSGIFLRVLQDAGVSPNQAVVIGNSVKDDIWGGEAIGIRSILLDREGRMDPSYIGEKISSLQNILEFLTHRSGAMGVNEFLPEANELGHDSTLEQRYDICRLAYME